MEEFEELDNEYGYKVFYKNKHKLIRFCITNSYDLAKLEVIHNIKTSNNIAWYIIPITSKKEYFKLWKNVPF